ncbi:sigma-70 family RNA polymerase sigma factor [Zavarzinia compransoris]|uniref:sigma-70 family RNA polymerase sigma factor n=1 Tax=Zavarzinia marina TaxID=2911065 RepID=UPI001F1A4DB7|nr:sigma-70 family RNA polymerase sigma factor [Zavarzinia marina]MCF4165366.1 sigma-70 family RNA polymerase sigma factor [Zavarzinia marina]
MTEARGGNGAETPVKFDIRAEVIAVMPHLRAFARFLTGNRERADDLVQDAVVRALTAAHQFQPGTNFKAWMFTILRNLFYNEGRKARVKMDPLDEVTENQHAAGPTQEAGLEFDDFRRAFWRLTEEQREVLILVGASGVSYEEAAEICNCAVGTIKSRVSRARTQLTRILGGDKLGSRLKDTDAPLPAEMAAFLTLGGPKRN